MEESINNKEIDLLGAFSRFFKNIGKGIILFILFFYKTIKRYKYIYIATIIIAIILVVLSIKSDNKTITAFYDTQYNEVITSLINKLDKNIKNQNIQYLSKAFNLKEQDIKCIKSIKIEKDSYEKNKINQILEEKVVEIEQDPFEIYCFKIIVSAEIDYDKVQKGLIYYLSNNKYLLEKRDAITFKYEGIKNSLVEQIKQLAIYQKKLIDKPEIKTINIVENKVVMSNDNLFNDKVIQLSSKLANIEDTIRLYQQTIRFISDLSEDKRTSKLLIFFYFVLAISLSFFISSLIELLKWIEKQSKLNIGESDKTV